MNTDTLEQDLTPNQVRQFATFPQFCHTLADLLNAESGSPAEHRALAYLRDMVKLNRMVGP